MDVDEDVETKRRVDRARVLIRTPWPPTIKHVIEVHVDGNGDTFKVYVAEECGSTRCEHHNKGSCYSDSSDEQESADSLTGDEFVDDTIFEDTNREPVRASPSNHRSNTPQSLVGVGDTTITRLTNGWKQAKDPMDNDEDPRVITGLNDETTFNASFEMHAAKLPCMESYLNGQQMQACVVHESRQREKGESSGVKCQSPSCDYVVESSPTKGKQVEVVVNNGAHDREERSEYQNMALQCGSELLNEPPGYLGHTPSNNKKAMGCNWQVYCRGSWSHRRHQRLEGQIHLEGSHKQPNIIQQNSSRNNSRSETRDINRDLEQEPNEDTIQAQEAFKMWEMIQQLGVTTGNKEDDQQSKILNKLSSMETRDRLEAERLGANVMDP